MSRRKPTDRELRLISSILEASPDYAPPQNWRECLNVVPLQDGGMGSLRLQLDGKDDETRKFKARIGDLTIKDQDDVDIIVSLNIDNNDDLFELDVWKVNFEPTLFISEEKGK